MSYRHWNSDFLLVGYSECAGYCFQIRNMLQTWEFYHINFVLGDLLLNWDYSNEDKSLFCPTSILTFQF